MAFQYKRTPSISCEDAIEIMNNNAAAIVTGASARQEAVKRAITQLADEGITGYVDKRGRNWTPEAYVNMCMRTTAGSVAHEVQTARCEDYGINLIEIDSHAGARPDHREWQGKVYSHKQLEDICGLGTGAGLCGWNCRHDYYPFIPGISKRLYSDEWLKEKNEKEDQTKEWMGKEYNAYEQTQKQRQMETACARSVKKLIY